MRPVLIASFLAAFPTAVVSAQRSDVPSREVLVGLGEGLGLSSAGHALRDDDSSADEHDGHGGHERHGFRGSHIHNAGEWMFSVRAMHMHMDGMRDGTDSLSSAEVLGQGFMVTPTQMDMDMLMFGGMYATSDTLTWMMMVPYLSNSMDHRTGLGAEFTTESEGLGDVRVSALLEVARVDAERLHVNLGVSLPTGSIDERDDTPAMANAKLPYPMQLGTGTFDLLPGLTYLGQDGDLSWGAQGTVRFHLGENDEGYRHGNRQNLTAWVERRFGDLSASFRLEYAHWANFHGADSDLNPNMVPTADPGLRGGDRLDALIGIDWESRDGANRLALEAGVPVYEDLDGPALETDWLLMLAWEYTW